MKNVQKIDLGLTGYDELFMNDQERIESALERVENGIVYTVEGNSGDSCRENHYPVGYYEILGYGILNP